MFDCFCSKGGKFLGRSFFKGWKNLQRCNNLKKRVQDRFVFLLRVTKCIIMSSSCKISTKLVLLLLNIVTHTHM